jgi:hypothetical protein
LGGALMPMNGRRMMLVLPKGLEARVSAYARRHGYVSLGEAIRAALDVELKRSEGSATAVAVVGRLGRLRIGGPKTREDLKDGER